MRHVPTFDQVMCADRKMRDYPRPLARALRIIFRGWTAGFDEGEKPELYGRPVTFHFVEIADPDLEDLRGWESWDHRVPWPGFDKDEARKVIPYVLAAASCTDRYSFRDREFPRHGGANPNGIEVVAHKEGQKGGKDIPAPMDPNSTVRTPRGLKGSKHGWETLVPGQSRALHGVSAPALIGSFKKWAEVRNLVDARIKTETAENGAVRVTRLA